MSVVAVKVNKDTIEVAADSIIQKDDLKRTNFKKLQKFRKLVVGGCGGAEELSLFFEYAKSNVPSEPSILAIQHYMRRFAEYKSMFVGNKQINNEYIIIFKNHVFEVDGMFVQDVKTYTAIGQGEAYALSALYLGHDVVESVDVACALCNCVSKPIVKFVVKKT